MKKTAIVVVLGIALIMICSCSKKAFSDSPKAMSKASLSILTIEVYDQADLLLGTGSGFFAFDSQTIVTNFHVIDGAYRIIAVDENNQLSVISSILDYDEAYDIALLKTKDPSSYEPLFIADEAVLQKGEKVVAIGSPLGLNNMISSGTLSGFVEIDGIEFIQFTAPISPGSSGGALFDNNGVVIGVTSVLTR